MQKLHLPHVLLPAEYVSLLKANLAVVPTPAPIFDVIRPNQALYMTLENAFKDFDDGRGLEKTMMALGWPNFRDRMGSIYIYKKIYGHYPVSTSMELMEEIKLLEQRFFNHSVHGHSRLFLLGFYLKMANFQIQHRENNQFLEIKIPEEISPLLKLSQGRSEKVDWLILILTHFLHALGDKLVINALMTGKKFEDLYELITPDRRKMMFENLLAYGASINEPDVFLYEKI
ncbi:MAG: hypothetical protein NDI69_03610 [Bacteriovoracaceae bacterium]|nr:hypothetical protein [Bacteriovoracaceae bacterium]